MGITLLLFIKKERIDKLDHIFLRKNSLGNFVFEVRDMKV